MCTNTTSICLSKKIKQIPSFSFIKLEFTTSRERTMKLFNALLFKKPTKEPNQTPLIMAHSGFPCLLELSGSEEGFLPADRSDPGYPGSISPIHPVEKDRHGN